MNTESQTPVQKTDEELFQEVLEARSKGEDVGKVFDNVEIVEHPLENEEDRPESEEGTAAATGAPAASEKEEVPDPAEAGSAAAQTEEEWLAGLPEEAKAKVQALKEERLRIERDHKALLGRVPYLNRKVDELQRQLSTRPAPAATQPTPAAKETSVAEGKFATKLAEARAVDPALAELLEAMRDEIVNPLREEIATKTSQTENALREKEEVELWKSEKAKLLERIPQADEVFKHPLYKEWKKTLPENQFRLASSIYADDVEIALGQFAKYAAMVQPAIVEGDTPAATTQVATTATAGKVVADRARKLAASNPGAATPTPRANPVMDEELRFAKITERIRQGKSYSDLV